MSDAQLQQVEKTGVFDISNKEYHASEGISRSAIVELNKSAKHYWYKYINPDAPEDDEEKEAMILGSAVHHLSLEKDTFWNAFHLIPKVSRSTTAGKALFAEAQLASQGKNIINEVLYEKAKIMSESLLSDEETKPLFVGGQHEKSIYWVDKDTGVLCKCRPDIWHANMLADIKTTSNGSKKEFAKTIYNRNYHIQAAMMIDGIYAITGKLITEFAFVICDNTPPFATGLYWLRQKSIDLGREEYKEGLENYLKYQKLNNWKKGYGHDEVDLPHWAFSKAVGE